jgi:hypothetical protein
LRYERSGDSTLRLVSGADVDTVARFVPMTTPPGPDEDVRPSTEPKTWWWIKTSEGTHPWQLAPAGGRRVRARWIAVAVVIALGLAGTAVWLSRGPSRPAPIEVTFDDIVAVKAFSYPSWEGSDGSWFGLSTDRHRNSQPLSILSDDVPSPFPAPIERLDRFDTQVG